MLKACRYCGRIHAKDYDCGKKPKQEYAAFKKNRAPSKADRFRWSGAWKNKAEEVRRRDLFLCRACLAEIQGTERKYNSRDLSVHHIVPLEESFLLRLDMDNLITLCGLHHRQAERGEIPRKTLSALARKPVRPDEHPPAKHIPKNRAGYTPTAPPPRKINSHNAIQKGGCHAPGKTVFSIRTRKEKP